MPRKHGINLVTKPEFKGSTLGKVSVWALSVGRWIVIVTEIIVIGAFIYRITLDQQIHDLQEHVEQQKSFVASLSRQEEKYRQTQKQLQILEGVLDEHKEYESVLFDLAKSLPPELALKTIRISEDTSVLQGTAKSEQSISTLIDNLRRSPHFPNVKLNRVALNQQDQSAYDFDVSLQVVTETN